MVVAGGIVRNRAWAIPRHAEAVRLSGLEAQAPMRLYYVTGDNDDLTVDELVRACATWDMVSTGHPGFERDHGPTRYDSANMAMLRNIWARNAFLRFDNLTHLWVVDSDVVPDRDCLKKMLELDAPVVGAIVPGCSPAMGFRHGQACRTGKEREQTEPYEATMLGGCYLIQRQAWLQGLRWAAHPQGEDGGFGDSARALGIKMIAHPGATCAHMMERPVQTQGL